MKKKGFTLIELLAVIVILAIIALIATPLVLKYIEKSRQESKVDSAYSFIRNLETQMANYAIEHNGTKYTTDKENIKDLDLNTAVKGENPDDGKVCISSLGQIEKGIFKYGNYYVSYDGKKGSISDKDTYDNFSCSRVLDVCTLAPNGDVSPEGVSNGDKYLCKVKDSMEPEYENGYTFYVLSQNDDGSTNLILERNICEDGTLTEVNKEDKCLVKWNASGQNINGPVTAMDHLYKATKDWENISNIIMNYTDAGQTSSSGYGTIITENNITKITKKDGSSVTVLTNQEGYSNLKARLPFESEISTYDKTNKTNSYLYDYLHLYDSIQTNQISGIYGYWLFRSEQTLGPVSARYVHNQGAYVSTMVTSEKGVRPVITIEL